MIFLINDPRVKEHRGVNWSLAVLLLKGILVSGYEPKYTKLFFTYWNFKLSQYKFCEGI